MTPFQNFIQHLSEHDLEGLRQGKLAIGCNDRHYLLASTGVMARDLPQPTSAARAHLLAREQDILGQLYASLPLCYEEFNYQAESLLQQHGAERFYRDGASSWALMIDITTLTAVPPEDVRSQYGYYCEGDAPLPEAAAAAAVWQWLAVGMAYEDYRVKTHCRYTCAQP